MEPDTVEEQLKNLNLNIEKNGDEEEDWLACSEEEEMDNSYKVKFSNFPEALVEADILCFFTKHPLMHQISEDSVTDVGFTRKSKGEGIITLKNEIAFALVLDANGKSMKKQTVKLESAEDPDVTARILNRVVIPELGKGIPYIDEEAANKSVVSHEKSPAPPAARPEKVQKTTRSKQPFNDRRNNGQPNRRPNSRRPQGRSGGRNATFRGNDGSGSPRRSQTLNYSQGRSNTQFREKRNPQAFLNRQRSEVKPAVKFNLELAKPDESAVRQVGIFGTGKPRIERASSQNTTKTSKIGLEQLGAMDSSKNKLDSRNNSKFDKLGEV